MLIEQTVSFSYRPDTPAHEVLELFGRSFFDFCQEAGYDKILQVLGATTTDFLQNLDALHDHLAAVYPGMRAPSFRCSSREDGATILHYYSDRDGLEYIVIGLVKAVAMKLHQSEVRVEIYKTQRDGIDHVQFLITEVDDKARHAKAELEEFEQSLAREPRISPTTFCQAFPFHFLFDRSMRVIQAGNSIMRVMPDVTNPDCKVTDLFDIVRPIMNLDFDQILAHINTVYVLRTKSNIFHHLPHVPRPSSLDELPEQEEQEVRMMRLKGQMIYVPEADVILFLCSPCIVNLDDLSRRGLYLSDIPLHDATRDLVLLSEHFEAEYRLTQKLEVLTDQLQQTYRELEDEKKKTDR